MGSEGSLENKKDGNKSLCTSANLYQVLEEYDLLTILEAFNSAGGHCLAAKELRDLLNKKNDVIFEDSEYESIFAKIDMYSTGAVSWDDFISFLILGYEQSAIGLEYKSLEPPIPTKPNLIHSHHRTYVIRILFCPILRHDRSMTWSDGSYMTLSRDGIINYWTLDMEVSRTVQSTSPELKITNTWVTDMAVMPDVNIVCTSSSERDLRFYDSSARKFQLRVRFTSLDYAVTALYYFYPNTPSEESKLILGDMGGTVTVIFVQTTERGPFKSVLGMPLTQCRFDYVKQGNVPGFRVMTFQQVHTDFVRQVYFYKSLHSVVSCAACQRTPFAITDVYDTSKKQDAKAYKVPGGVWCFDILDSVHIIGTGGPDCLVRVWNPFMPTRPTMILYRHHTGIIQMTFQDSAKVLYTLSKDRNIKVWDLQSQQLVQNYIDVPMLLGEKEMTTLYNPESRQWIIGSAMIALIPLSPKQSSEHTDGNTHCSGVSCVLYNTLFKVIVTVGIDSYILVWNPWDGRNMLTIKDAHVMMLHGLPIPVEITAACFSQNKHFLLTAAHNGSLKIWDFHNGTCLRNMKLDKAAEICKVFWVGSRLLATGCNRRITEFNSRGEAVGHGRAFSKNWDKRHTDDISAAAIRIPQSVVTAAFNGDIIMWRLETGQPYKKYNVSNPTVRIKIQYKLPKHKTVHEEEKPKETNLLTRRSIQRRASVLTADKKKLTATPPANVADMRMRRVSMVVVPEECLSLRTLAVHCMMFLNNREMDPQVGSLLISLENGVIQVWSHDVHGGFITSFSSIHKAGDYVLAMATDENSEFLFTGHCAGYIKTWLIKDYCVKEAEPICLPKYRLRFPYMWGYIFRGRARRIVKGQDKPTMLNTYKGHYLPISSLAYIDEAEIIISGSADRSARLWTLGGRFLQTVGSFKIWKPIPRGRPTRKGEFEYSVPADLKRLLSSTSLRVLNGGYLERPMTKRQMERRAEKERIGIDPTKVYGKDLVDPILGHYYSLSERTTTSKDIIFDCSFPHIPVYQHLIMPTPMEVKLPKRTIINETDDLDNKNVGTSS